MNTKPSHKFPLHEIPIGVSCSKDKKFIFFNESNKIFKAYPNECKHMGSSMVLDKNTLTATCPIHNWKLDCKSGRYLNPDNDMKQTLLKANIVDGFLVVENLTKIFENNSAEKQTLAANEFTATFYTHACMKLASPSITIFTDPWLEGPCFTKGWWLKHKAPENWLSDLIKADFIYISHNHSDHLHTHTLKKLFLSKPNAAFLVPPFRSRSVHNSLEQIGFTNFISPGFNEWLSLEDELRIMILPDSSGRDDSAILVEYKGHKLLNTVDCSNPNEGDLPRDVDVLLSPFASGASGFPVCWEDFYPIDRIKKMVAINRKASLEQCAEHAAFTNAKLVVPFAGYFSEEYPGDSSVKLLNIKNKPEDLFKVFEQKKIDAKIWIPRPNSILDFSNLTWSEPTEDGLQNYSSFDFASYTSEIDESFYNHVFTNTNFLEFYFKNAGYQANHVLEIIETNEDFQTENQRFLFDFMEMRLVAARPNRQHQYSRFKIRASSFRHVLVEGLPWEDLSIGFQMRFYRDPDVYEFQFWDHFQNKLPNNLYKKFISSRQQENERLNTIDQQNL